MQKVQLDPGKLNDYIDNFKGELDVEYPELREIMGLKEDEVAVLTIKAASLNDHIRAQSLNEQTAIMAIKMAEWAQSKGKGEHPVDFQKMLEELTKPMMSKTYLEVSIFHRCVIKPTFTMREAVRISEVLPEVVNRVASTALLMSSLEGINGD